MLPRVVEEATRCGREFVTRRVAAGDPGFAELLASRGGWSAWDRVEEWQTAHRAAFTTALTAPAAPRPAR